MKKRKFVDTGFGKKGYWAWLILLCLIGLAYKAFLLSNSYSTSYKNIPEIIIFSIFIFNILLLAIGVMFVVQGIKTAQRIELVETKLDIILYFGKHFQIEIRDIQKVEEQMQHAYIRNFITPLGRGGKIYKVSLKESSFYINEVMEDALMLLEEMRNKGVSFR
jgi:hypothetical protein